MIVQWIEKLFRWEFHMHVHICNLVLAQNRSLILNWNSKTNLYFSFNHSILSSHSLLSFICSTYLSGTSNDCWLFCSWECWKFYDSGCWLFCVGGTEGSVAWGAEGSVAGGTEYFGGAFLFGSAYCHPSLLHALPHFLQMGQCGPHEHFSVACLGITIAWGIAEILGGFSVLMVGVGVGTEIGGISQSFPIFWGWSWAGPSVV